MNISIARLFVLLLLLCGLPVGLSAQSDPLSLPEEPVATEEGGAAPATKAEADSALAAGDYALAVELYEALLTKGESLPLHYNLGNAYFRLGELPRAILSYRRALRLNPSDADAAYNLSVCESRLTARFDKGEEMFFVTWVRELMASRNVDAWGDAALICFCLCLAFLLAYLFTSPVWLRKATFSVSALLLASAVVFTVFAARRQAAFEAHAEAVVLNDTPLRSSPAPSAGSSRQLVAGLTVEVTGAAGGDWWQVRLPDGSVGWIEAEVAERV